MNTFDVVCLVVGRLTSGALIWWLVIQASITIYLGLKDFRTLILNIIDDPEFFRWYHGVLLPLEMLRLIWDQIVARCEGTQMHIIRNRKKS